MEQLSLIFLTYTNFCASSAFVFHTSDALTIIPRCEALPLKATNIKQYSGAREKPFKNH